MTIRYKIFSVSLIIFLVFTSARSMAQTSEIQGQVSSETGQKVNYATVSLRTVSDDKLVRGISTDSIGRFVLNDITPGSYVLYVKSIGMVLYKQNLELKDSSVVLPEIHLKPDSTQNTLNEVKVTTQVPFLKRQPDKLVVDIANSVYNKGENAMRLFNVVPGFQLDAFGNILFRGTEAVTVYINNAKLQLSGQQLANYLKGIPSESIKSYEVRSIGGAQFDANTTGTIVNIILKSDYKYGLSGSAGAEYQYTKYSNVSTNANLNFTTGKFTFQVNGSLYTGKQFEDQDETQYYKATQIYSFQKNNTVTDAFFGNYKVGLDYRLSKNQILTANYEKTSFPYHPSSIANNRFSAGSHINIDSAVNTDNKKDIKQVTTQVNFVYRNKLDTVGSTLDIGYSYIGYNNRFDSRIISAYNYPNDGADDFTDYLSIRNPLSIHLHTFNADVEKKMSDVWTLNFGSKYNTSETDNDISYFSGPGNTTEIDNTRSNQYQYKERIFAFYGSLSRDWEKWALKVGLRTENTNYRGVSVTNQETIKFDRWSLFPSIFLQHKINSTNSLTLSYSRNISRPSYELLNPFENIQNPYYIETGNPFLLPYFTYKTELAYLLNSKYSFSIGYNRTVNSINSVYENDGPIIISSYDNVNNNDNIFFYTSVPLKFTEWWDLNSSLTLRYSKLNIKIPDFFRVKEKFSQDIWINNRFKLTKTFFAEVIGRYSRNQFLGIYDWKAQGNIDVNFKKNFYNDKLSMTLNFADPFNLRCIGWKVDEREFTRNVNYRMPTRFVSFGISYNFSKGKNKIDREKINRQDEEEKSRLNN